ncbi:MAG: glycoside hydrolase family 18 protein [Bacteroidales bacterium]
MQKTTLLPIILLFCFIAVLSCKRKTETESPDDFAVMAYYAGNETVIDDYDISRLTHIIFSFCRLEGNQMIIPKNRIETVMKLVSLKDDYPELKIILALGGWGGCETCSEVFSSPEGRSEFAYSVKELLRVYGADGVDMDWEYPAISGFPGHPYMEYDKRNFTLVIENLRDVLGVDYEIGFAGGGFKRFFDESVEWDKVMPVVDYVNIMTYDLVSGGSPVTGHHTPLYSTPEQIRSVNYAVNYLDSIGVDPAKIVIGAAFYGRAWENVPDKKNGLYQTANFKTAITYRDLPGWIGDNAMMEFWDETASAPYAYSEENGLFVTYDNPRSVELKIKYAKEKGLAGIMFWQLGGDRPQDGLLQAIYRELE